MKSKKTIILFLILFSRIILSQDSLLIWETDLKNPTSVPIVLTEKNIFYSGLNGEIFCLDLNGNLLWKYDTFGTIYSTPVDEGELLAVSTYEGDLTSININTGNLFQVIGIGEIVTSKNILLIDIERDGIKVKAIIIGTENGNLYCYDLYTLEQFWEKHIAEKPIVSSIISSKQKIFFYDDEGTLYCVNGTNGLLIWKWKIPSKNPEPVFKTELIINHNNLYLVSPEGNIHCIDVMQGTEKWDLKKINASGLMTSDKNNLIVPTTKNKLLFISTKTGKVEKEIELVPETKENKVTELLVKKENVFAGFENGLVYELSKNKGPVEIFRATNLPDGKE
ncbi:MAG TPA: PQQ-binding-like beta-propeller repeat protein, partial [Ignavibacteriaceae bacterium]